MQGYVPGEQPLPGSNVIKLNTNENPYPPSPAAVEVLRRFDPELLRRYPDPYSRRVVEAVHRTFDVPKDWIMVGNGSDELLSIIIRSCCGESRCVVYPMPTYVLYRTLAEMQDTPCREIPFDDAYTIPVTDLVAARGAVTLIASPNSPSGSVGSASVLAQLAGQLEGLLVVDEAYVDFAEESALGLLAQYPNLVILRTLSKGYSLAGLRLGFAMAHPDLLNGFFKVKDSYNVNAASCLAGAAAIEDQSYKTINAHKIVATRMRLSEALTIMGFRVWPSQANFILVRPPQGNAEELYLALKERGILVRYFNQPKLDDKLRISIGTDEQTDCLIRTLAELIK